MLALTAAPVLAQSQATSPAPQPDRPSNAQMNSDEQFVKDVVLGNMTEVQLGNLAAKKASGAEVKRFGERMAQDHGKALADLKALAKTKNIMVADSLDSERTAKIQKLDALSGPAFDRAYTDEMVNAHQQTAQKFKTEISSGKDAEIKAWAAKVLPTVEEHLKLIEGIRSKVVGTTGK
jgi:putative membrane protein